MSVTRLRYRGCWREAAELLAPAADHDPVAAAERAGLLAEQCLFTASGWDAAEEAVQHALALARTEGQRAAALCEQGHLAYVATLLGGARRTAEAEAALDEAATLASPSSSTWGRAQLRRGLVAEHLHQRPDVALAWYAQAHDVARTTGDLLLRSSTVRHLAGIAAAGGDREAAEDGFRESLKLRLDLGFTIGVAPALAALADVVGPGEAQVLRAQAAVLVRALGGVPVWLAESLDERQDERQDQRQDQRQAEDRGLDPAWDEHRREGQGRPEAWAR